MSKGDSGLTRELKKALTATRGFSNLERMNEVKKAYYTHRQLCISEAVYGLTTGMVLKFSSVKTIFVATGLPQNRSAFWKRVDGEPEINQETNDQQQENEIVFSLGETVEIDGREGKFEKTTTMHESYSARPNATIPMCLAQFATHYDRCNKPQKVEFEDGISVSTKETGVEIFGYEGHTLPKYIIINDKYWGLRGQPKVLRIHASHKKQDFERKYSELLLFIPWIDEDHDLAPDCPEDCEEFYDECEKDIEEVKKKVFPNQKSSKDMKALFESEQETRPEHIYDAIDPIAQQMNAEDAEECPPLDTTELPDEEESDPSTERKPKASGSFMTDYRKTKPIILGSDDEMLDDARTLTYEQQIIFDKIMLYAKQTRMKRENGNLTFHPDVPYMIAHGKILLDSHIKYQ